MAWSWISWFRTPKLSRSTSDHVTNMWDPWQTKTYGMFGRKFTSTACPQSLRSLLAQQVLVWLCPTKGPKCKFLFEQGIGSRRSPTPFLTNATRKTGSCQVANRSDCSVNFGRAMKSGLDVDRALLTLPAERHTSTWLRRVKHTIHSRVLSQCSICAISEKPESTSRKSVSLGIYMVFRK